MDIEAPESGQRDITATTIANARRVQEALRTLEELAKMPEVAPMLHSENFKQARFDLYSIERELVGRVSRRDKAKLISGLYVIIDTSMMAGRSATKIARRVISGGARVIQLRDKTTDKPELLALARELLALCCESGVLFIVNDYLDVAVAAGADGLHLGRKDLPVAEARRLLPLEMILGRSVTGVELATAAEADGADYIAVGSIYPTTSKDTAVVVGPEMLRRVRETTSRPLVAIGGINNENAAEVIGVGADAVAVISGVLGADDPEEAARRITARFEETGVKNN
jgi:thiamine-phosphate pyrophosphorylase